MRTGTSRSPLHDLLLHPPLLFVLTPVFDSAVHSEPAMDMTTAPMSDHEVLQTILVMLHRLETRLEEQTHHRRTISPLSWTSESQSSRADTNSTAPTTLRPCSCISASPPTVSKRYSDNVGYQPRHDHSSAAQQPPQQRQSALAYLATIARLRNQFEFDSTSDLGQISPIANHNPVTGQEQDLPVDEDEVRSVSVYPSRPLSRLDMSYYPPSPGDLSELSKLVKESIQIPAFQESVQIPAFRYEDTASSQDSASENPRSTTSHSQSGSVHTADTTNTSLDGAHTSDTAAAGTGGIWFIPRKQSYPTFSKIRATVKRSISLRSMRKHRPADHGMDDDVEWRSRGKGYGGDIGMVVMPVLEEEKGHGFHSVSFVQVVGKGARACVSPFPRAVSWVGRAMVNQQMRMFDH